MTDQQPPDDLAELRARARINEPQFTSNTPIIGGLIVWFRNAWNSMATKWYVRPIIDQQSRFNAAAVDQLERFEQAAVRQAKVLAELDWRLIEQDREQTRLLREQAELGIKLERLREIASGPAAAKSEDAASE